MFKQTTLEATTQNGNKTTKCSTNQTSNPKSKEAASFLIWIYVHKPGKKWPNSWLNPIKFPKNVMI